MPSATSQSLVSHLRGPEALCSPPCICLPFTLLTLTHLVSLDPLPWEAPLVRYITGAWNHHIPPHEGRGHSAHSPQPKGWGNLLGGHLKAAGQDSKAREETAVRSRVLEQTSVGWTFPESRAPLKARSVKDPPAMQQAPGSIPGSGRSPGEGIGCPLQYSWASLVAQLVKNPPAMQETWVRYLGWKIPQRREGLPTPGFWPGE